MWVYAAFKQDRRPKLVMFDFQTTRGKIAVNTMLHGYQGIVQTDGYGGYNALRHGPDIIGIGCGAHIRRKFAAVQHLAAGAAPIAKQVLARFQELYAIEAEIREHNLDPEPSKQLRQERALPIISNLQQELLAAQAKAPPQSALGKAINYALWSYWTQ